MTRRQDGTFHYCETWTERLSKLDQTRRDKSWDCFAWRRVVQREQPVVEAGKCTRTCCARVCVRVDVVIMAVFGADCEEQSQN